ncbi:c-type cytochrome [Pontimicrobium sp. IMCC45349]|jgi:mono/diheme cytochrome c family protein|uniref:c-type cytochrome n=1 Tax=Pontimicrobium sp. IMCC45349 TaxID=3391574 RepID=UPI0039A32E60
MKSTLKILTLICTLILISCGGGEEEKKKESTKVKLKTQKTEKKVEKKKTTKPSQTIDLTTKGVGPIKSITLGADIDQAMATKGEQVFKKMCTACHKAGKKFIGPAPDGILKRRTPEWIMNMILNPEEMVSKDALAKSLLIEFNGSPMANQNLTEEEARAVLEYFRTLN